MKIIQIMNIPETIYHQGAIVGLGDDGVVYDWTSKGWVSPEPTQSKETLYIAVKKDTYEHLGGNRKVRICSHAFVNKQDAESYLDLSDSVLVEIKV